MNDFERMLDSHLGHGTLLDVSYHLAETPCGPLQMNAHGGDDPSLRRASVDGSASGPIDRERRISANKFCALTYSDHDEHGAMPRQLAD